MGLFDLFKKMKQAEKKYAYIGETPPCPRCGKSLTKRYVYSGMYCEKCGYGLDDDEETEEAFLSVYDAALIWASNGKDEDYMFGYTEEELEDAL